MAAAARSPHPVERVRLLSLSDVDARGVAAWERLSDRAAEPNPYFRHSFVETATRAHGLDTLLLVATSGEDWVFCLPVERAGRWRRLAVPCLVPALPELRFLSVPLVDRDRVEDAVAAFASFLAAERRAAALVIDPIDPDGAVGAALRPALARTGIDPIVYASWERGALRRRPEPTYLQEAMSGKRRKELRRLHRALGRELGGEVVTVDRSHDPLAYDTFLKLERDGWKGDAGTAIASTPEGTAFFRSMCQAAARDGRLQLLALEAGDRTVAMQCNLIDDDVLFGFKVAYDTTMARFSPGALLEVEAIRILHETLPVQSADSCAAADSELINRIWPDRRRMETLVVPTGARRAALVAPSIRAEAAGRKVARAARARLAARGAGSSRSS